MDVAKRDMDGHIVITEPDGHVGLKGQFISRNNDMDVQGELTIRDIFHGEAGHQAKSQSSNVNQLVMDSLSTMGLEIGARFHFKTKMDDFRVTAVSFEGNVSSKPQAAPQPVVEKK